MDYFYFVLCVFAMATILTYFWRRCALRAANSKPATRFGKAKSEFSELELKRISMQENIEIWQRSQARRLERLREQAEAPATGRKYRFTPPAESRATVLRRRSGRQLPLQRFELIG